MKKILSMLLIAAFVLALPTAAGAAEEDSAVTESGTAEPAEELLLPEEPVVVEFPTEAEEPAGLPEEAPIEAAIASDEPAPEILPAADGAGEEPEAEEPAETAHTVEQDGLTFRVEAGAATLTASDPELVDVVIPEQIDGVPVMYIGESAFMNHTQLQSVSIPASVERIQGPAFPRFIQLGSDGYVDGTGAFYGCTGLTSVDFAEGSRLKAVGTCAFYRTAIREIELPSSVLSIGEAAFARCGSLQSIRIPDGVPELSATFMWCAALKDIHLPEDLVILDNYTFDYCGALQEIALPDSVQLIGVGVFAVCTALERVTYAGESLDTIGSGAFGGCEKLKSCPIPATLTTLGDGAFAGTALSGTIEIPSGITRIEASTFSGCRNITKVILPEDLESIGSSAFFQCAITGIDLPDGLTAVGDNAFCFCTKLKTLIFPDSVREIGNNVVNGCTSLTKVHLPKGLKRIEYYSFVNCSGLTEIDIPDGVTSIGGSAFQNCKKLKSITLPDSVEEIGDHAFWGCAALRSVRLSPNVRVLEEGVFSECTSLQSISIPEGIEAVREGAFYGSNRIKEASLPASLRTVKGDLFNIDNLSKVEFAGTREEWNRLMVCNGSSWLRDITVTCADGDYTCVGDGYEGVNWYLFKDGSMDFVWNIDFGENRMNDFTEEELPYWLDDWFLGETDGGKLRTVCFHEGVASIGAYAFASTDVKTVTLSKDIKSIGAYAFSGCAGLTDVYYEGTSEQWAAIAIGAGNDALRKAKIHYGEAPGVRGVPGDADGNGRIDAHDLQELMRYLTGETFQIRHEADLTGNGVIDQDDLLPLVTLMADQLTAADAWSLLRRGHVYEAAWALRYATGQAPA